MKIFAAFLISGFTLLYLIADARRGIQIPYSQNVPVNIQYPKPHLIGTSCCPGGAPSLQDMEKSTDDFRAHPWMVVDDWRDFRGNPEYIRRHQDICEAAGFKCHFPLLSCLQPLQAQH